MDTATMKSAAVPTKLRLLPRGSYTKVQHSDPVRYYYWPLIGQLYCKRVESCLAECVGGQRVLEVGFGSGVSFLNLKDGYDEIHGIDLDADVEDVMRLFEERNLNTQLLNGNVLDLPYPDDHFDTVLLVSILEHLKAPELEKSMQEIHRVLKPGAQIVYGVPVERPLMVRMFALLGHDIREHHFSTEIQVREAASRHFKKVRVKPMTTWVPFVKAVYEVGHFVKE